MLRQTNALPGTIRIWITYFLGSDRDADVKIQSTPSYWREDYRANFKKLMKQRSTNNNLGACLVLITWLVRRLPLRFTLGIPSAKVANLHLRHNQSSSSPVSGFDRHDDFTTPILALSNSTNIRHPVVYSILLITLPMVYRQHPLLPLMQMPNLKGSRDEYESHLDNHTGTSARCRIFEQCQDRNMS